MSHLLKKEAVLGKVQLQTKLQFSWLNRIQDHHHLKSLNLHVLAEGLPANCGGETRLGNYCPTTNKELKDPQRSA